MAGKDGRDRRLEREPVRRTPYGRRADSRRLVTDPDVFEFRATAPIPYPVQTRMVPMPHGRMHCLVRCPKCGAWRRALYAFAESWCGPDSFAWCRYCLRLGLPAAYTSKCAEADEDRIRELEWLALHDGRCTPQTRQRRWERARHAREVYNRREREHYERVEAYNARELQRLTASFGGSPDAVL